MWKSRYDYLCVVGLKSMTQKNIMINKSHSRSPKSFGHSGFASKAKSPKKHFGSQIKSGGRTKFSKSSTGNNNKFKNNFRKSNFKKNFKNSRKSRGFSERIDYSRFIKKAENAKEEKVYVPKNKFSDFAFSEQLHKNIKTKGFSDPRPIQDQAILEVMAGKDVFGLANTGTGKTAAFLLPTIEKVFQNKLAGNKIVEKVLIMAPTRELALQIEADLKNLSFGLGIFSVSCVGGMPIMKQIREIQRGVSFVIGTPGRVKDLINRKILNLADCDTVILDEADRMLDMGFKPEIIYILARTAKEKQTLFFSATLSPEIKKLTEQFLKNPVFISVISGETQKNIDQDVVRTKSKEEKIERLDEILKNEKANKVLIFRERKHHVDELVKDLKARGFKAGGIHGDKRSRDRIRILESFKKDDISILIATDVAARGLDIPNVSHVINYDIPQTHDTYVHRIGRTGRAGKKGIALTFI